MEHASIAPAANSEEISLTPDLMLLKTLKLHYPSMIVVPQFLLSALTILGLRHSTTGSTQALRLIDANISDDSILRQQFDHDTVTVSACKKNPMK